MPKWEYQVDWMYEEGGAWSLDVPDGTPFADVLNLRGKEGWELVTVLPDPHNDNTTALIFKR